LRATVRNGDVIITIKAGRGGADLELWAGEKEVVYFREVLGRDLVFKVA